MKKSVISFLSLLLLFTAYQSKAQGIEFIHDKKFEEVLAMAKAQNKLVFMDCYTSWCGPCKRLAATVFPDSAVGEYFNDHFISCKFDMEKDEGPTIAAKYSIRAYPTLLWLDYTGEVKHKIVGGLDPAGLIQNGKKATDPTPGILAGMHKRYADGDRDVNFLSDYLNTMMGADEKYEEVFKVYMDKLTPADLKDAKHAKTIFVLTNNLKSPGMAYLMKNEQYYKGTMGVDAFNNKINVIASKAVSEAPKANDPALFEGAISLLKSNKGADNQQKIAQLSMDYYLHMADWANYDKSASQYIKKYAAKNASVLNDVAWNYYLNMNNDGQLAKAAKWAYDAINIDNKYTYNLTYAYLLYKLNEYKEAQKACDYAIIQAKSENVNAGSAEFLKGAIQKSLDKEKQP
ncbi:MAG: thioredoxin domain-containing protein [Chitinophagales bacterium]